MMNKLCSLSKSVLIAGGTFVVSAALSPLLIPGSPSPQKLSPAQAKALVEATLKNKCSECHVPGYTRLGLLNTLSGGLQARHIRNGIRAFDMSQPMTEVTWAKLEHAISSGSMPPPSFTAVHWGSTLKPQEKDAILNWIRDTRVSKYAGSPVAPQFKTEPIQPIPDALPVDARKVALGEKLFHDKRLSIDNTVACSTCHVLDKAGTDNLPVSEGVKGQKGGINAPTVFNAAFHFIQFWDGRAKNLEEQAGGPPLNPVEMGYAHPEDWNAIANKLKQDEPLTKEFLAVYPEGYSAKTITNAIAEYEKTLITPNSPFDRYLKGDENAISKEAKEGYALFKKNGCQVCHVGVAMGGQSFEFADLKGNFFGNRPLTQDDNGRMNFTKSQSDIHKFRVPTLRNVALTWPYMHDASAKTLAEAVDKMFNYQIGQPKPTKEEVSKIVAFLNTLTGEYNGKPLRGQPAMDAQ